MKRRYFLTKGTTGAVGLGFTGCSALKHGTFEINQPERTPIDLDRKVPKTHGTMPMAEIGKTGIRVSRFGFGSHMRRDMLGFVKEREWMVREACDLGVNFFDVYDYNARLFQFEPMGRYLAPVINNVTKNHLPEHYQFLEEWAPDSWDDSDLTATA